MSQKITAKNLSYSSSLPPFLAALRAETSGSTGPDPLLAAQRRSAKKRSGSEEAEDAPLVVDEYGNVADFEVEKDGTVRQKDGKMDDAVDSAGDKNAADGKSAKKEPDAKAAIGGRKRKAGKVVGEAADVASSGEAQQENKRGKGTENQGGGDKPEVLGDRKPKKKKAKKIKLSFDDDDG